ncbi:MAG: DUF416 family protein [Bacteroidota bacterium]
MDKYSSDLATRLRVLNEKSRVLFAYWVSKRLFHNYVFFHKTFSFGDVDAMLDALNLVNRYLSNESINVNEIQKAIDTIEENTPDTNDFDSISVSFALDACNSLTECLSYLVDKDLQHLVDIGIFSRDTIDMFIQEKEDLNYSDDDFEQKIQNHYLMTQELLAQKDFLLKLKKDEVDKEDIVFTKVIDPSSLPS